MHELIAIFLITGRRHIGAKRCMGGIEQNLAIDTLGNPVIVQLAAHVLQFEEELLVREGQPITWCFTLVSASQLQQSPKKIYFVLIRENIYCAYHVAVAG